MNDVEVAREAAVLEARVSVLEARMAVLDDRALNCETRADIDWFALARDTDRSARDWVVVA